MSNIKFLFSPLNLFLPTSPSQTQTSFHHSISTSQNPLLFTLLHKLGSPKVRCEPHWRFLWKIPISEPADSASPTPSASQEVEIFYKRRLEEKFAVLNTGVYECRSCGYKYDEAVGGLSYPIPPGFQFEKLPDDCHCPTCGAAKSVFDIKSFEIAVFAQNQ